MADEPLRGDPAASGIAADHTSFPIESEDLMAQREFYARGMGIYTRRNGREKLVQRIKPGTTALQVTGLVEEMRRSYVELCKMSDNVVAAKAAAGGELRP